MAGWPIRKNDVSGVSLVFPIYDADGDLVTGAADLDSEISKDGGAFADVTAEATEIGTSGIYSLALAQAEINADYIVTITKTTTTGAKTAVNVVYTSTRNIDDLATTAALTTHDGKLDTVDGIVDDILVDTAVIGALGAGLTAIPWNADWDAEVESEVDDALATYDAPTKAEMDTAHALLATVAKQDVIDGIVDDILVDTAVIGALGAGLTAVPWNADWDAEVESEVDDALATYDAPTKAEMDTAHALLATVAKQDVIDGIVDDILADTGTNGVVLNAAGIDADAATEIATAVFKLDMDAVEATSPLHSLTSAVLKAVSKVEDDAGTLKTYRTDGTTLYMSQTITTDAALDPIDSLTIGV